MPTTLSALALLSILALPAAAESDPEALRLIDEVRIASAGGRDIVPARIEIEAIYRYADDEKMIVDRTVIEPGELLFQEREIEGKTIRRGWQVDSAFLEGPEGRMELDSEMSENLELYLCRRQLDFLILCPGVELSLEPPSVEGRRVVAVRRGEVLLGELEIDLASHRLVMVRHPDEPLDGDIETDQPAVAETIFSEYRQVEGWTLPHRVATRVGGEERSSYSIERLHLTTD